MTRRDLLMALSGAAMAKPVASARPAVQGSTVFDWSSMTAQPTRTGAVRRVCQTPTATLDELEIHITTLNARETSHPPHQHPDEELLIVKGGTVESLVNGKWQRLGPGSVIFQASNQMHTIRNASDSPATYHVIRWNSPGMLKR
jgi:XRE family transcriptional regulator, regulator of sulfur utilization